MAIQMTARAPRKYVSPLTPDQVEEVRRRMADHKEGWGIPLEEVEAWLDSKGTDKELPKPVARQLKSQGRAPTRNS